MAGNPETGGRRITDRMTSDGTRVDAGIRIKGTVSGSVPVDVSGAVEGTIDVAALVWLRPGARVQGQIVAHSVVVEGQLQGTVKARDRVELRATCKVHGDIDAASVAIAEGSFFEGRIRMSGAAEGGKGDGTVAFEEKRRS